MKMKQLLVMLLLTVSLASTVQAAGSNFKDVAANHWAQTVIEWAIEHNIVTGYPDGTFRPSNAVTEAEFLSMFVRTYETIESAAANAHWAEPVYQFAASKQWPVEGIKDAAARNKAITRVAVAEIIAAADGQNHRGDKAIQYLLTKEYSKGKTAATVSGYKGNDTLNRAEAVQFIWNLVHKGFSELLEAGVNAGIEVDDETMAILDELLNEYNSAGPIFNMKSILTSDNDKEIKNSFHFINFSANLSNVPGEVLDDSYIELVKQVFATKKSYTEDTPTKKVKFEYVETSPISKKPSVIVEVVIYKEKA